MEEKQVVLRKAMDLDLSEVYLFERAYIIEHELKMLAKWDKNKKGMMALLKKNVDRMIVAEVAGSLAGHCYWSYSEGEACVYSIFVDRPYRGQGIGELLMKNLEGDILLSGHREVILSTLIDNPAQYLFNKMHYDLLGVTEGWLHYRKVLRDERNILAH